MRPALPRYIDPPFSELQVWTDSDGVVYWVRMATQKKIGRPTKYTKELATQICIRIAEGESLRSICKDEDMPSAATIFTWLLDETKREFLEQYETARNVQAEMMFEELLEIADDGANDLDTREREDGSEYVVTNHEVVQRSRLRVDTRKWYLSKVLPKKFGDKTAIVGPNDGPVQIEGIEVRFRDQ